MKLTNENGDISTMNSSETEPLLSNRETIAKKASPWHIICPIFILALGLG